MKKAFLLTAIFLMLFKLAMPQYQQIPLCEEKNLYKIKSRDTKAVELLNLNTYPGFKYAVLLKNPKSGDYKLLIHYKPDNQELITIDSISQQKVDTLIKLSCSDRTIDMSGKSLNAILTILAGVAVYPATIAEIDIPRPRIMTGVTYLGTSAAIGAHFLLLNHKSVSQSQAILKNYGLLNGLADGYIFNDLTKLRKFTYIPLFTLTTLNSYLGYKFAGKKHLTTEQSLSIVNYHVLGGISGILLINTLDETFHFPPNDYQNLYDISAFTFKTLGAASGYWLSKTQLPNKRITNGDLIALDGLTLNYIILASSIEEHPKLWYKNTTYLYLSGLGLGTLTGTWLIKKHDFSVKQALLANSGALLGGFTLTGISYLVFPKEWYFHKDWIYGLIFSGSALTSNYLLLNYFALKNKKATNENITMNLYVNPLIFGNNNFRYAALKTSNPQFFVPAFSLNVKF